MEKKNFTGSNVKYWAIRLLDDDDFRKGHPFIEYREIGMFEDAELKMARDRYLKEIERIQAEYDK